MTNRILPHLALAAGLVLGAARGATAADRPNIVIILADDLGYGDVKCVQPGRQDPDAAPGQARRRRDDVHRRPHPERPSARPTRYGLLTGRYCWRSKLKSGVLGGLSPRLIEPGRLTVAALLKYDGYHTACIGKWHLGMDWRLKPGKNVTELGIESREQVFNVEYDKPIKNGPNALGFDSYFGISRVARHGAVHVHRERPGHGPARPRTATSRCLPAGDAQRCRKGPAAPGFEAEDVLPTLAREGGRVHRRPSRGDRRGRRSSFTCRWPVAAHPDPADEGLAGEERAEPVRRLRDGDRRGRRRRAGGPRGHGLADDTAGDRDQRQRLLADGRLPGPAEARPQPEPRLPRAQGRHLRGRAPGPVPRPLAGPCEAGHDDRPARVPDGRLRDLCRGGRGAVPATAAEDSVSLLPTPDRGGRGDAAAAGDPPRVNGSFAIRDGNWKLCLCPGSGGWSAPRPGSPAEEGLPAVQLFDLSADIGERANVAAEHPDVVVRLTAALERIAADGRSTPGEPQPNTTPVDVRTGMRSK